MSGEANSAVVRRFFEEVVNAGQLGVVDEIFAPRFVLHDPLFEGPGEGNPDDVRDIVEKLRTAFSDVHVDIDYQIAAENDAVVTRWTANGTHNGRIESFEPSYVRVELHGMSIFRLSAGKIVDTRNVMVDSQAHAETLSQLLPTDARCNLFCHICPRCCR